MYLVLSVLCLYPSFIFVFWNYVGGFGGGGGGGGKFGFKFGDLLLKRVLGKPFFFFFPLTL